MSKKSIKSSIASAFPHISANDAVYEPESPYSYAIGIFPDMKKVAFEALKLSISKRGLQTPIATQGGKIVDGRQRYLACLELGITPEYKEIGAEECPITFSFQMNAARRHLTDFEKVQVASKLKMLPKGSNQHTAAEGGEMGLSQAAICKMLGIKICSLQRGRKILNKGTLELIGAVEKERISLAFGAEIADLEPDHQKRLAMMSEKAAVKELRREMNLLIIQKRRAEQIKRFEELSKQSQLIEGFFGVLGKFSFLLVDPPWDYLGLLGTPYPTMPTDDICAMPVQDICHEHALMFMWAPSAMLPDALRIIAAWGFTYKTSAVWDKQRAGQGAYFRQQHEFLLVATKGSVPQVNPLTTYSSVISSLAREHSRKPDCVYEMIEHMYPELDKIELFSRNERAGWTMWGNEAEEEEESIEAASAPAAGLASAVIESAMAAANDTVEVAAGVVADAKAAVQASMDAAMQAVEAGADPDFDVETVAGTEVAVADEAAPSRFNAYGVIETPDGEMTFSATAGKATAAIQVAQIGNDWLAEYRYGFRCGDFQSTTLSLSAYSKPFPTQSAALVDAATRLIEDVTDERSASLKMPASQKKAKAELVAWAKSVIEANKPNPPVPPTTPVPPTKPLAGLNFVDLFAGVGGFHQALSQQGAKCVAVVEIDQPARETYLANYPGDYQVHCDIHDVVPESLPAFDILTGGFPCQSFSMAGDRLGYNDPTKGALFFEIIRIAKARQPKVMILENVEGFMNHDGGRTADTAINELAKIGYTAWMRVLNAAEFGVPQQRKRVFIIAIRDDIYQQSGKHYVFPAGVTPSKVVADILEPVTSEKFTTRPIHPVSQPSTETTSTILLGLIDGMHYQSYKVYSTEGQGTTLLASATSSLYLVDGQPRRLSAREYARMQGFPETFKLNDSPRQAKKQMGNSVAVPVVSAIAETIADIINGAAVQGESQPDASQTDVGVVIQFNLNSGFRFSAYSDIPAFCSPQ